jgi:hypothetical protein
LICKRYISSSTVKNLLLSLFPSHHEPIVILTAPPDFRSYTTRKTFAQRCRNKRLKDLVWASRSLCSEDPAMPRCKRVSRYTTTSSSVRSCFTLVVSRQQHLQEPHRHWSDRTSRILDSFGYRLGRSIFQPCHSLLSASCKACWFTRTETMLTRMSYSCSTRQQSCSSPRASLSSNPRTHQSKRSTALGLTLDSMTSPSRAPSPVS